MNNVTVLEKYQLTEQELTLIVDENPSLRGMLLGYIGEYKLRALLLSNPQVTQLTKPDDHSRKKGAKNDITIEYRGYPFTVEVKSLQTNSIRQLPDGTLKATAQVDASDRRPVILRDGSRLETTCLLRGEFDLLAINTFQFQNQWEFGFILNRDLPSSRGRAYTQEQREQLLATSISLTHPLQDPYHLNPFDLLDILIAEKESQTPTGS